MNAIHAPALLASRKSRRRAFSLLEVAFALVIFVIGALALLRIFPGGLTVLEDSSNRRTASQMSQGTLTAYTSGDLAPTTPDQIYDGELNGNWTDYPSSSLGLRRQVGTIPVSTDDFYSAKDALEYIKGERQQTLIAPYPPPPDSTSALRASFFTNYTVKRNVNVYREGVVNGVSSYPGGILDFRNAVYSVANRGDLDTQTTKTPFREPILAITSVASTPDSVKQYGPYSPRINLSCGADATVYTITFARDYDSSYTSSEPYANPSLSAAANDTNVVWSGVGGVAPAGFTASVAASDNAVIVTVNVPAATDPRQEASFQISFNQTEGLSLNCAKVTVDIQDSRGGGAVVNEPQIDAPLAAVRAPKPLRSSTVPGDGTTYYVSSSDGQDQPLAIPLSDATYPTIPNVGINTVLSPQVRFLEKIGTFTPAGDKARVVMVPTYSATDRSVGRIADVDNYKEYTDYTNYYLGYQVRDWEVVSEDISQFTSPYPGDEVNKIEVNSPVGQVQQQFLYPAGSTYIVPSTRDQVKEIRTRLGNLRGPVEIKGFYQGGGNSYLLDINFNQRAAPVEVGVLTDAQMRGYTREVNSLMRTGRFYLPARYLGGDLVHARVYYRSREAWAQQVGVTATHYLPFNSVSANEPWRTYFVDNNFLYFHASEAGKTVEVVYGTDPSSAKVKKVEIRPEVIVNNLPAGMPTTPYAFTGTYTNVNNSTDPRNGKTYIARTQDRVVLGTGEQIFDVRRPQGTSGISVRTLWLYNDRYVQEVAE